MSATPETKQGEIIERIMWKFSKHSTHYIVKLSSEEYNKAYCDILFILDQYKINDK